MGWGYYTSLPPSNFAPVLTIVMIYNFAPVNHCDDLFHSSDPITIVVTKCYAYKWQIYGIFSADFSSSGDSSLPILRLPASSQTCHACSYAWCYELSKREEWSHHFLTEKRRKWYNGFLFSQKQWSEMKKESPSEKTRDCSKGKWRKIGCFVAIALGIPV